MNKFLSTIPLFLFCCMMLTPLSSFSMNDAAISDTTHINFREKDKKVKLTNEAETILVRKGDILKIDLGDLVDPIQVRIHSSLGRLIKYFRDVTHDVSMQTKDLQPGIYMVIIKRQEEREIRRVLITEAQKN